MLPKNHFTLRFIKFDIIIDIDKYHRKKLT